MGGTPLLLALALVLVDYGWESDGQNGYRYIVQVPEHQYETLRQGGQITSRIPDEIRGRVTSIEVRFGDGVVPRQSLSEKTDPLTSPALTSAASTSSNSFATREDSPRVETAFPAPPDTQPPTIRGQNEESIKIPSLGDLQATGQEFVDNLSAETQKQIGAVTQEVQNSLQNSLRDGTQASVDYLKNEAQKLFAGDSTRQAPSGRLALPSSPQGGSSFASSQPSASASGLSVSSGGNSPALNAITVPNTNPNYTTNETTWGSNAGQGTSLNPSSGNLNSTLLLGSGSNASTSSTFPTTTAPDSSAGATYPVGSSSPYNPNGISGAGGTTPISPGGGTAQTPNSFNQNGLPNYTTTSPGAGFSTSTFPPSTSSVSTTMTSATGALSAQDYWSLERALTKDQQSERDARLLNEVGIGPGEVFVELRSQKPLIRTDPRYAAMTDYMNRFYTYQRASSISSNATTLANPVSTGNTTTTNTTPGTTGPSNTVISDSRGPSPNNVTGLSNPLDNMTFPSNRPTTNAGTNPYFNGQPSGLPSTTTPLTSQALEEAIRKRAEELLRWEANNPRLSQNTNNSNGGYGGTSEGLGVPPSLAQGTQTAPGSGGGQGNTTNISNNKPINEASASDQKDLTGDGGTKRREYQPQALVNFFLLLSLVGNIYLGIAISRLIRRYRNLVAVHRGNAVLST